MDNREQAIGVVGRVMTENGYGFIDIDGDNRSIFFHYTDLDPSLVLDEKLLLRRVRCRIGRTNKGYRAFEVEPA